MIKNRKKILAIVCLFFGASLLPLKTAISDVYFISKDDDANIERSVKDKPCPIRGYRLTSCPNPETPDNYCYIDGVLQNYFKKCVCDEKYKITANDCLYIDENNSNQVPTGDPCKGKYEKCGCPDNSNFVLSSVVATGKRYCEYPKVPAGTSCTQNAVTSFSSCECPAEYNQICTYPYKPLNDELCNEKARKCSCEDKFKYTCDGKDEDGEQYGGGKAKYSCTDPETNITKYSICNSKLPQIQVFIVDGMFDGADQTSCFDNKSQQGLDDVRVTFTKSGYSEIVTKSIQGVVQIAVPFETDDDKVDIKIEKYIEEDYEGEAKEGTNYITLTDKCPCDGKVYALSPKNLGEIDQVRIITTWGSFGWVNNPEKEKYNIKDLDIHLMNNTTNEKGEYNYLFYQNAKSYNSGQTIVIDGMTLDVDDTKCFGPETINFPASKITKDGKEFYFSTQIYTHNMDNRNYPLEKDTMSKSQITVYAYVNGELKRIFKVGAQDVKFADTGRSDKNPTVWNVFKAYKNGETVGFSDTKKLRNLGTSTEGLNNMKPERKSGESQADANKRAKANHGW